MARRAGVTQSVVSAYETGGREPSLRTLVRLVRASGGDLDVRVRPQDPRLGELRGPLGHRIQHHREELVAAVTRHGGSNLRVFGSVARGEEHDDSDIDLLVDHPASTGLLGLARLQKELSNILGTTVDLVPGADLKAGVRSEVESVQVLL